MEGRKILRYEPRRGIAFPRGIESRIYNLLDVARTESHQITFLQISNNPKTGTDLRRSVYEVTSGVLDFHDATFSHYCADIFTERGVVTEGYTHFNKGKPALMWKRNRAGEMFAKPVCSFLLKKAVEFGMSVTEFLNTPNGYFILEYILSQTQGTKNKTRETDISNALGLSKATVLEHLLRLKSYGIINYQFGSIEKGIYEERSHQASLTPEGREITLSLIPIRRFVEEGYDISVKNWQRYTIDAAHLYQEAKQPLRKFKDTKNEVYQIIKEETGIRTKDIKRITGHKIHRELATLKKEGLIKKTKKKDTPLWKAAPN